MTTLLLVSILSGAGEGEASTRLVPQDYPTIQAAIDEAAPGDTVLLSPGTYRGPGNRAIELRGKDIIVTSVSGPEDTVIECEYAGRGFYLHEDETRAARIEKLTIQHGWARLSDPGVGRGGAFGIFVSSPTIADCRILENQADNSGGGVSSLGNGLLLRCVIAMNWAGDRGGGIAEHYGELSILDCVIAGNYAGHGGGGVAFVSSGANIMEGCTVTANYGDSGGAVWTAEQAHIRRCILWGNFSEDGDTHEISFAWNGVELQCSAIDTTGVIGYLPIIYDECVFSDPLFCGVPSSDFTLRGDSPCLPEHSPCGELIGALGEGCSPPLPLGACCFADGSCGVMNEPACAAAQGTYQGDNTVCVPNPCEPVPVMQSTWGRIKATYGGQGASRSGREPR